MAKYVCFEGINKKCFKVPFPRIELMKQSFKYYGSVVWNNLPSDIIDYLM